MQWTNLDNRDPAKTYNKIEIAALTQRAPGFDWRQYLDSAGIGAKVDYVIVSQPSYLKSLATLLERTPLATLKLYLQWQLIAAYDHLLPKAFADERFAFYGTTLNGMTENTPRWRRGIGRVEEALGDALGKLYVERHFPPERKARIETMVRHLLTAFGQGIDTLEWMSPATTREARAKLAKITLKIAIRSAGRIIRGWWCGAMTSLATACARPRWSGTASWPSWASRWTVSNGS
ncbi:MAG: hypothetical protein ACLGI6_05705 [Gammaproteobacteria bacterium]